MTRYRVRVKKLHSRKTDSRDVGWLISHITRWWRAENYPSYGKINNLIADAVGKMGKAKTLWWDKMTKAQRIQVHRAITARYGRMWRKLEDEDR